MKFAAIIAAAIGFTIATSCAPVFAKTVKECDAEYSANKDAIKGSGQKKADFVAACRVGNEVIPGAGASAAPAAAAPPAAAPTPADNPAGGKTAKECAAEYSANKAAIKASGQTKKDYVAACRAGTATVPPTAPAANAAPAPAPAAPAPAPSAEPAPAPAPVAPAPKRMVPTTASEAQAQTSCPTDTVVWVNTNSGIYHFKDTHNYGTTKAGTFMCESAAKAAGDRAAKNEKHP